ncbi:hypothetical protein BDY24DRAFT_373883 [Mrakia frigida]|uniref:uncharacterized protein n=1 Tax=Mrakia frigida TaxID=29902 RepID=UPI003FCC1FD9
MLHIPFVLVLQIQTQRPVLGKVRLDVIPPVADFSSLLRKPPKPRKAESALSLSLTPFSLSLPTTSLQTQRVPPFVPPRRVSFPFFDLLVQETHPLPIRKPSKVLQQSQDGRSVSRFGLSWSDAATNPKEKQKRKRNQTRVSPPASFSSLLASRLSLLPSSLFASNNPPFHPRTSRRNQQKSTHDEELPPPPLTIPPAIMPILGSPPPGPPPPLTIPLPPGPPFTFIDG